MTANKSLDSALAALEPVASGPVRQHAADVDRAAMFPQASLDALASAGLLGLTSAAAVGGQGLGLRAAAHVVERLARECGSTAMVTCMHYCGTAVIEKHGTESTRKDIAAGRHLTTLAFSETGSRSHFWAPMGTATAKSGSYLLDAQKSWVTSADRATSYVWSSRPSSGNGLSSLWLVPRSSQGLTIQGPFDGIGLRGNDSAPVRAEGVVVPESARLGADGAGFDIMMADVLPTFSVLNAACSIGLMEGAVARTAAHCGAIKHEHLGSSLAELPTIRAYVARMRVLTDMTRTLWLDTIDALETGRPDAMLRVLECKAAGGESATQVLDLAMRVCAGAAFRKDVGVERYFRDARASTIMAPTTDQLYDFIGKAACGLPVF